MLKKWTPLRLLALVSLLIPLLLMPLSLHAEETQAPPPALMNVDMTLDLDGMEKYAKEASQSLQVISESLQSIVNNPNLSEDQQQALNETIASINQLSTSTTQSINHLPEVFEHSRMTFQQTSQTLLDDIQSKILIALIAIVGVIILALIAIYLLILKPMQHTLVQATSNISAMAQSIQITAEALKYSTDKQQYLMEAIDQKNDTKEELTTEEQNK
ncbi:GTP-binding protein [Vibrio fortis]|uniref:GTP-binding protein n=1 Tax=Vibrio fortis TaxID=212667 RepID=A0A5N3QZG6_9VIBR|nr:GTP-binding protein [Vibrio fortis]